MFNSGSANAIDSVLLHTENNLPLKYNFFHLYQLAFPVKCIFVVTSLTYRNCFLTSVTILTKIVFFDRYVLYLLFRK